MTKTLSSASLKIENDHKKGGSTMTQEWFESADLEKKSPQTKSEIQPNEPETSETVVYSLVLIFVFIFKPHCIVW